MARLTRDARPAWCWRLGAFLALGLALRCDGVASQQVAAADTLQSRFAAVRAQEGLRVGDQPLYLQSTDEAGHLRGELYALTKYRHIEMRQALAQAQHWCGILILHPNVKYCRASGSPQRDVLDVGIGRNIEQPLSEVHWMRFEYRVVHADDAYLQIQLTAPSGPMGTRDFRVALEAMPHADGRTLLHMTYAYAYGRMARWALQAYLATLGRDKVGFSVATQGSDDRPAYVTGTRGLLERNTMRYYLAVEAYLGSRAAPAPQKLSHRLQSWFDATERYARQLHEVDRDDYISMKLREVERQQAPPQPGH